MNENKVNLDFVFGLNYAVDMLNRSFPDGSNFEDFTLDMDALVQVMIATGILMEALDKLTEEKE